MVGKAPQPNAREKRWQDQARECFPVQSHLHHCRERKTKYIDGVIKVPIGQLFVIMMSPEDHKGIHQNPNRREIERWRFEGMCERLRSIYGEDMVITEAEINACMEYR